MKQSNHDIWIYGDLRHPSLYENSLHVLSGACSFAECMSGKTTLVLIHQKHGDENKTDQNNTVSPEILRLEQAIQDGIAHGADTVLIIEVNSSEDLQPKALSEILKTAVLKRAPSLFLFPLTDIMREVAARCAYSCHTGLIADCIGFKFEKDEMVAVCPSFEGEVLADLGFTDSSKTGFITVQPSAFQKIISEKPFGAIDKINVTFSEPNHVLRCTSRKRDEGIRKSLETAEKVVVGGAGLGNSEGFRQVRKLAQTLGAEMGATRPPVLWHWIEDDRLIGQTGKTVKPEILISVGTSGAVQYTAGITGSPTLVAINRDNQAPIFKMADIGIVADAAQFLPLLIEKIQNRVMRSLADSRECGESSGSDFGSKLMKLRESHGLSLQALSDKAGRTPEFIRQIETNKTTPSVGFLIKLSEVFDIDPGKFLNEDEKEKLTGKRAREYTKRTANYHYQTLTPDAENEHLRVFMITIESQKAHKPVAYRHDGEEFVFVMEGKLELTLGEKAHILMAGESMKFNSDTPHKLKSMGNEKTKCLVTLYTP